MAITMYVLFFMLFYFLLCVLMFFVFVFFFLFVTWREAPCGVVASRHSSLCYCFWALIIVLLFLGAFLVVMLFLGTFHRA